MGNRRGRRGRLFLCVLLVAGLAWTAAAGQDPAAEDKGETIMENLTPVLYVEEIEPCLPFWTDRLGFEVTGTVPEGENLGFAMLEKGGVEIMYQTSASMEKDIPTLADRPVGSAFLFIRVEDIDAVEEALSDLEKVVPRRTTEYGATEVGVLEPGGNVILFAEFGAGG